MKKSIITALAVLLLLAPFLLGGCGAKANAEGLAIYLTKANIPPDKMGMLSHFEIADKPVISQSDIVSYDWDTHEIQLTARAFSKLEAMEIPTTGISFLVCVNKNPVYWGAFWTLVSSRTFNGVTIMLKPPMYGENIIRIELGYPAPEFFSGSDPRNNLAIKQALEKAGKLQ